MALTSSNPIFARSEGFNGRAGDATQTYPGTSTDPSQWGIGTPGQPGAPITHVDQGRMTIDSVVQKTGLTLLVVFLAAAATWVVTPEITSETAMGSLYAISMVGALGGFALAMVNSFKKVISPALVLLYAAFEGVFVGAFSKVMESLFVQPGSQPGGLVIGAVLGTMAAVAGTLAAYKFFNIKVGTRFYKWVLGAGLGFVAVLVLDMILGFFGKSFGVNGFGPMGLLFSVIGLGLGVLFLILDFDQVERGIAAGLPERESWRAAFGLTVTIIWIYIEMLRILAILRGD